MIQSQDHVSQTSWREGKERLKCPPPDSQTEPERVEEQEVVEEPKPSGLRGQTAHQAGQISQGVPKDWRSAKEYCNFTFRAFCMG